jgi:YVTN family beta-propeller protein
MKKIKFLVLATVLFSTIAGISFYLVRSASYTIQTSGKLYIVNKLSRSITVFDLFKGEELTEFTLEIEPHEVTTLTGQNNVVVTNYGRPKVNGKSVSVIDTKTNDIIKTIDLDGSLKPHGIVAFPNTTKVGVVTDIGNELVVVNVETGTVEKKIQTQQVVSHLLVLHPNKSLAYVTNIISGSVSVIDLVQDKVIEIILCGKGTEGIDITPDGTEIWVTNNKEESISVINTETYQITDTLATGKESLRLKFSIDGKYCLVPNSSDGTISVYDRHSKKQIKTIHIPGKKNLLERVLYHTPRPVGILMHPNGLYAFVANSNADKIEVIDMKTFTLVSTIGTGRVPDGLTFVE